MKRIAALPLAALILTASALAATFTEQSNKFCTYRELVINGQNVSRFSCEVIPATLDTGAVVTQDFYIDMAPNADNTGGTFTGQFYVDAATIVDFSGNYTGSLGTPQSMNGTWAGGFVGATFGVHRVGNGTRYQPYRYMRYVVAGSGSR